jgi:hypothetical protein
MERKRRRPMARKRPLQPAASLEEAGMDLWIRKRSGLRMEASIRRRLQPVRLQKVPLAPEMVVDKPRQ